MSVLRILFTAFAALIAGAAAPSHAAGEKKYALPEHGFLQMGVPAAWDDELRPAPPGLPPTIAFRAHQGASFEMFVTPAWRTQPDAPAPTRDGMKQRVQKDAADASREAVEKNVRVVEFAGASGPGFYFSVTDPSPKPGEYKYMTQGLVQVNDLLVSFTVLTNDPKGQVARGALGMLKTAVHLQP